MRRTISEQLFAEFRTNQERISETAKLPVWLKAFTSADGQWERDLFEDTLMCLKDSSLLQAFVRELEGIYHFSSDRFIKDRIRLRTNKSVSQENTDIHGSGTCEGDSGEFMAKKRYFGLPLI